MCMIEEKRVLDETKIYRTFVEPKNVKIPLIIYQTYYKNHLFLILQNLFCQY